jgi:soluble lytic murein transglycosylase-like protein
MQHADLDGVHTTRAAAGTRPGAARPCGALATDGQGDTSTANRASRDAVQAAELYCRAARHGDAESQYNLAWMLTNSRGIERDEAQAAHLFAAAAEQGYVQARNILARMGTPQRRHHRPACDRPTSDAALIAAAAPPPALPSGRRQHRCASCSSATTPTRHPNAPEPIVRFVNLVAPDYGLQPHLVLAIIATESRTSTPTAVSPKNAHGPDAAHSGDRGPLRRAQDHAIAAQNIRGGMAYLRWLIAYFEGDVVPGGGRLQRRRGAVERYLGVPPYAENAAVCVEDPQGHGRPGQPALRCQRDAGVDGDAPDAHALALALNGRISRSCRRRSP